MSKILIDEATVKLAHKALSACHYYLIHAVYSDWQQELIKDVFTAHAALREALAEQPAQGCDYCNHPQYAGTKCKNCGREQPAPSQQCMEHGECFGGECIYPAPQPAQRKPLTDELNQIEKDLSFHGLTLVKTATGYAVLKLGQITAHSKGDA